MSWSVSERLSFEAYRSTLAGEAVELPGATVLRARQAPGSPMLNRIVGLGVHEPASEDMLDGAITAMAGLRYYVTLSPSAQPPELESWLVARGFEPGWGWMQFARPAAHPPDAATTLDIVRIGPEQADAFGSLVSAAFGLPAQVAGAVASTVGAQGWTCWLAYADGEPAAAASLYVDGADAYLGLGCTLPQQRGRGAQSALLAARIREARDLGCAFVYTETGELRPDRPSSSYRNIRRAGFRELYVVPNWINPART